MAVCNKSAGIGSGMSPLDKPNNTICLTFNVSPMLAIFCPQQSNGHVMITVFDAYRNHVCSVMDRVLQRPLVIVVALAVVGGGGDIICTSSETTVQNSVPLPFQTAHSAVALALRRWPSVR